MWTLRIIGLAMVIYGGGMLLLLQTEHRDWALDHSIAEVVSTTDRRANNQVTGSVDEPMAIAGSAVVMFAGAWIGLLVPFVIERNTKKQMELAGYGDEEPVPAGDGGSEPTST